MAVGASSPLRMARGAQGRSLRAVVGGLGAQAGALLAAEADPDGDAALRRSDIGKCGRLSFGKVRVGILVGILDLTGDTYAPAQR